MDPISVVQLLTGAILAALAVGISYAARALTRGGAAAAFLLGTVVFGLGGLQWAVLLLLFFISSSLLSFLFKTRKSLYEKSYSKSSRRDAGQVLANGGLAGAMVLIQCLVPGSVLPWLAFAAAFAAANADTWATELGVFNPRPPRMINSGKTVDPGTSGAISPVGTLAALAGSMVIGLFVWIFSPAAVVTGMPELWKAGLLVTFSGLFGSLVDSLLGASVQAIFYCPRCGRETEKHPLHTCGTPTSPARGWKWLTNDWVNFFCTLSASLVCILIFRLFQ